MWDATPLLRLYAAGRRARLARQHSAAVQQAQLKALLRRARDTPFGSAHGFAGIDGVGAFQAAVPLRRYEGFWQDWFAPVFPALGGVSWPGAIGYLAVSSGTSSGATKWIPVSREMVRANTRAALEVLVWHLAARRGSHVFA